MPTRIPLALVFPEGLLLLIVVAIVHWGAAAPAAQPFLPVLPVAVLGAGLLIGWRFQRGRLLLALAGLALADRAMLWLASPESGAHHAGPVVVRAVGILLPVMFAVLACIGERGLASAAGIRRLAVLAAAVAVVLVLWLLSAAYPEGTASALDLALVPVPSSVRLPLGQPATLAALVGLAVLVARTGRSPDAESRGLLWAAVAGVVATSVGPRDGRATLYLAGAGLIVVVAMVESAYALAYHDELTGLPARRALNDALLRLGDRYTVAMVDVDHFKKFNDTHGHDVGDQVLRMVAGRLAGVTGGGQAFRYGGEEFAVLFPHKTAMESAPHLEALRAAVAGASFTQRGADRPKQKPASPRARNTAARALTITVSIGIADARGSALPDLVVKAADKALYRAKDGGRNRVSL